MAVKGSQILYNLLFKEAVKKSGQASGVMSIGDSVRELAKKKITILSFVCTKTRCRY